MKYFTTCTTLDELKKEYRRLAMANHPDRGGDEATMKAINAEYASRFIEYIITITRTFSDGTKKEDSREVFPGKERCKAIARYKALLKQYPGIPAEMDIEKRSWEK